MRHLVLALALVATTAARAEEAKPVAEEKALQAWELDAFLGYGQLAYPGMDTSTQTWSNGGPGFALTVAYRGQHFTHPFLDVAYVPFVASGKDVYMPDGTTMYTTGSTHAWAFTLGPGFDVAWFRVRGGVGLYLVSSTTKALGVESTASSPHLGYVLGASALVWNGDPFAVGVEARLTALNSPGQGIYETAWATGLTGRWDFARH